ncbi:MAG: methyltransferase domain-containing protein [Planctomycetota bacterium]|nr:methyltransferase domain-containing protein [Planctomycetota bacterium]
MTQPLDRIAQYNRKAWDQQVENGQRWTQPVDPDVIARARKGDWEIVLTPSRPIPKDWFGSLVGAEVLCLASGGGQQVPILAAVGAQVTVLDNSPRQLEQDRLVARRDGLEIRTVLGDMRSMTELRGESFDLIVHPCSNCFVPEIQPVWGECFRVLKAGGSLLTGFLKSVTFIFDENAVAEGMMEVRHRLPYSDESHLTEAEIQKLQQAGEPLMFSHSLEQQIGGQLRAGFQLVDLYEDRDSEDLMSKYFAPYLATRALKPAAFSTSDAVSS